MKREHAIIDLGAWLDSPAGRCLLDWELAQLDQALVDLFGFHALQLGLPELDGLRANRMPQRWLAHDGREWVQAPPQPPALHCLPEALPFPDQSLDLVLLPHALETSADPHQTLVEAARVLRPEGRLVVLGFNPVSLWMLRQGLGRLRANLGLRRQPLYLPEPGEAIGYWRLRDWMRLVQLEPERARFGCYRLPARGEAWLRRWAWMEAVGERWWPVFGAVYLLQAVKRVRGMRMVGLAPARGAARRAAPAVVANRHLPREGWPPGGDNPAHE